MVSAATKVRLLSRLNVGPRQAEVRRSLLSPKKESLAETERVRELSLTLLLGNIYHTLVSTR